MLLKTAPIRGHQSATLASMHVDYPLRESSSLLQGLQHLHLDVIENKHWVTTGVVLQDLLEVRTTG